MGTLGSPPSGSVVAHSVPAMFVKRACTKQQLIGESYTERREKEYYVTSHALFLCTSQIVYYRLYIHTSPRLIVVTPAFAPISTFNSKVHGMRCTAWIGEWPNL